MILKSVAVAVAALCFFTHVSGKGQILGSLREVDEDNNIIGEEPFLGISIPSKGTTMV